MTDERGARPSAERRRSAGPSVGEYAGIGLQFALSIVAFMFAGMWLDRRLGSSPWLLILFVFVGAAAGFYSVYRKLMIGQRRADEARRDERGRR